MNLQLMSELFGGGARYRALRTLFENPDKGFGARELGAVAGIDPGAASRWLRRWADIGLLQKIESSRTASYKASPDPSLAPLVQFLRQDSEVVRVLRERLEEIQFPVDAAALFGSMARGDEHAESDIDLLLITEGSRLELQAHFKPSGRALGRKVNVLTFTSQDWANNQTDNALVAEILRNPTIVIKGTLDVAKA